LPWAKQRAEAVSGPISESDWNDFARNLTSQSRALVSKGDLESKRKSDPAEAPKREEKIAKGIGDLIAAIARKGVIPSYGDYEGIYCVGCDFSDVKFPDGARFSQAILDRAKFDGATLNNAVFDNAQLLGVTFVRTDLYSAKFRSINDRQKEFIWTNDLDSIFKSLDYKYQITIVMPNFSCANLMNAKFDNLALFPDVLRASRSYDENSSVAPAWYSTVPYYLKDQSKFSPVKVYPPEVL
jgi:hypothetical protein